MPNDIRKVKKSLTRTQVKSKWPQLIRTKPSAFWTRLENKSRFEIFQKLYHRVPAYKSFLGKLKYKPGAAPSENSLPAINKKNYFTSYSLDALTELTKAELAATLTATSGSTGAPTYFYRDERLDFNYSVYLELFLEPYKHKRTLFIDCFGMGVWIGGLLTFTALRAVAKRGFSVDIITPGVSLKDILATLHNLASTEYESVVLAGYPPFIKDILDNENFPKKLLGSGKIRCVFAAESFTEGFREYIVKKANIRNSYIDTMNIYGSAELGAMAIETPLSIVCRETIAANEQLSTLLFPAGKVPTIAQYNPAFVSFLERENRLLISGDSVTPFLLYDIGDSGKVFTFTQLDTLFRNAGINIAQVAHKKKVDVSQLPFVLVYERSDFSTSIYGLQIYPQHIKRGLEKFVNQGVLTGKFLLSTELDNDKNQFLQIRVEVTRSKKALPDTIAQHVRKTLLEINSEYRELSKHLTLTRLTPRVMLCDKGDPSYFPIGIKQKWVQSS